MTNMIEMTETVMAEMGLFEDNRVRLGSRRNRSDRYVYLDWEGNLLNPDTATTLDIAMIRVEHGMFGHTMVEKTIQGGWVPTESTFPGFKPSDTKFRTPEDAITAVIRGR